MQNAVKRNKPYYSNTNLQTVLKPFFLFCPKEVLKTIKKWKVSESFLSKLIAISPFLISRVS